MIEGAKKKIYIYIYVCVCFLNHHLICFCHIKECLRTYYSIPCPKGTTIPNALATLERYWRNQCKSLIYTYTHTEFYRLKLWSQGSPHRGQCHNYPGWTALTMKLMSSCLTKEVDGFVWYAMPITAYICLPKKNMQSSTNTVGGGFLCWNTCSGVKSRVYVWSRCGWPCRPWLHFVLWRPSLPVHLQRGSWDERRSGALNWKSSHRISARHHTCAVKAAQQTFHDFHLVAESGQRWP